MAEREAIFGELQKLISGDQQVVVLHRKGHRYSTLFKTGAGWEFTAGSARFQVLKESETKREQVMILDAQLDERLASCSNKVFRSALCIPVCRPWGVAALIFAESAQRPRAFTFHELPAWNRLAEQLAETMPETAPLPERPSLASFIPGISGRMLATMGGIFLLSVAVGLALRKPPVPKPSSVPQVSRAQKLGPEAIAVSYLRAIDLGQFDLAYGFLSSKMQKRIPFTDFEAHLKSWVRTPDCSAYLRSGTARVLEENPPFVKIQVSRPGSTVGWTWTLVRQEKKWKLDQVPGK